MSVRAIETHTFEREKYILGEHFDDFAQFFADLLSYCSELERTEHFLVAFVTRRCHVLLQLFLDIFSSFVDGTCTEPLPYYLRDFDLSNIKKIVDKHFVTDFNLLSKAGHIADYYLETGLFPEIVILDELIVHGRAINNLLLAYETAVIYRLEKRGLALDYKKRSSLLDRLADATKLRVYAQNDEPLLLLSRYQRQFSSKRLCSPGEIKELSQRFASLVISSDINNVAYSWNFKLRSSAVERWNSLPSPQNFVKLTTNLKFVRQDCCLWLYPNASSPRAICSIRWKQHCAAGSSEPQLLMVPFIIFDRVSTQNLLRLHNRICEDLRELNLSFLTAYEVDDTVSLNSSGCRWLSETNDLILNYLLFRRFCGASSSCEAWACFLETSILARNYKVFSFNESSGQSDIVKELKSIWSWVPSAPDQLEQYFDILLEGAQPIWSSENIQFSGDTAPKAAGDPQLIHTVEDVIAYIGYEAEKIVCEKYSSGVFLSDKILADWGPQYSLSQVLELCKQFWSRKTDSVSMDIYAVLALLVQEMDLGIIGMSPQYDEDSNTLYTMVRAGEHSLFIKPARYQAFIPVLISINKRCRDGHLDLRTELTRFMRHVSSTATSGVTADELYAFMQTLESVNQRIEDWNFQLLTPVDFQEADSLDATLDQISRIRYDQHYFQREYRKI